jgi:hypothetical protein
MLSVRLVAQKEQHEMRFVLLALLYELNGQLKQENVLRAQIMKSRVDLLI